MARIKDTSVEAVKNAADIVVLVEERIRLRKVGGRYTGLCPFHQEKSPSFSVSPDRGTYHCFGCGVGGDAIAFVQELEGLDFVGTIEWLADRFNIELEYEESSPEADAKRRQRDRLHELLEGRRRSTSAISGRAPPASRCARTCEAAGSGRRSRRRSASGCHPAAGRPSCRKAREKGFTAAELAAAGLTRRGGMDWFTNRLMFPLTDARGRIVGFQARKLREDDPMRGKYVNSPEGELFRKGRHPLRAPPRARRDREAGSRGRRRGEHRCDRAAAGAGSSRSSRRWARRSPSSS